ncbi:MAG: chemotaxis protein CheY [Acidobacteria bacterium]|nr:chemotaxis protein CheY [Acidobacteriota bacterium]
MNQNVLVVNDNVDQLEFLSNLLTGAGATVHQALNGGDALAIARDVQPDVIVSDVWMPIMDGLALCRAVRSDAVLFDVPVVLVSADNSLASEGFAAGADDYVDLPYDPFRLAARVVRLAQRRSIEQAISRSEAELRALFGGLSDVVLVVDSAGRFVRVAPTRPGRACQPSEELVGRTLHEVFPAAQADRFLLQIHHALETGQPQAFECSIRAGDEDVRFDGTLSSSGDGTVFCIARDVSALESPAGR